MKKLIIIFTLITGFAYSFEFQAGKELVSNGTFKMEGSDSIDIIDDLGIYLEMYADELNIQNLPGKVGVGIKFNNYKQDTTDKSVATVATIYGIWKIEMDTVSNPYFHLRFGYPYAAEGDYVKEYNNPLDIYYNDLAGVTYLSAGLGMSFSFIDLSVNYDYNIYKIKTDGFDTKDASSSNVSFNIGAKF